MPARTPSLGSSSNPFGVSNYAFSAFNLGGSSGGDPTQRALAAAAENRYEVGVRYGNGQASEGEYQAAIAAEKAVSTSMLQSSEASVADSAKKHIVELDNLNHDLHNHAQEVTASAADDHGEALLSVYQQELATMQPGSTGYTSKQSQIESLQKSIKGQVQADTSRAAAYELAGVRNAWASGSATDDQYKAAYQKYADSLPANTSEWITAHDSYKDLVYTLDRNQIVNKLDIPGAPGKTIGDLLAFDKAHQDSLQEGSADWQAANKTYQQTEAVKYAEDEKAVIAAYNNHTLTASGAQQFYQAQLGQYTDNRDLQATIQGRVDEFGTRVQGEKDSIAIEQWNKGTLSAPDFMAYAKSRQAGFAVGTSDYESWGDRYTQARDQQTQSTLSYRYGLSNKYDAMQKFVADHTAPKGSKTTRQIMNPDGTFSTVTGTNPLTPAQQAAWQKAQIAVADAKQQIAALGARIQQTGGYVSPAQMVTYYQGLQAPLVKGSPQWLTYQAQIDGYTDKVHADAVLSAQGVKVGYGGWNATTTPVSGGGGGGAGTGGTGGKQPGSSVPAYAGAPAYTGAPPTGVTHTSASMESIASSFIQGAGGVDSPEMRKAVMAWMFAEGVTSSGSRNNPWNLHGGRGTYPGQVDSVYVGPKDKNVAVFSSMEAGIAANAHNLNQNAYGYPAVKAALAANNPAGFLKAMQDSGWATSQYKSTPGQLFGVYSAHFGGPPPSTGGAAAAPVQAPAGGQSGTGGAGATPAGQPGATGSTKGGAFDQKPTGSIEQIIGMKDGRPVTAPLILPNLDSAQFRKLYSGILKAYNSGEQSFSYVDSNGHTTTISIPGDIAGRKALIENIDQRNMNLASAMATADPGGNIVLEDGSVTTKSLAYGLAVHRAGNNMLTLLSFQTPRGTPRSPGAAGSVLSGEPQTPTPIGKMSNAGRADALHPQVNDNSLTPLEAGKRLTDYVTAYIKDQSKIAEAELDAGHYANAYAIYGQIRAMTLPNQGVMAQIASYHEQAVTAINRISGASGAEMDASTKADLAALDPAHVQGLIHAAATPIVTRFKADFSPYVQTDAAGNVVADPGANGKPAGVKLGPGVVLLADRGKNGAVRITPEILPQSGYTKDGAPSMSDPTRVPVHLSDGRGATFEAQGKFHVGIIGAFVDPKTGVTHNLVGRIEDVSGTTPWVEDPMTGKWLPGPIRIIAPPGFKSTPVTDAAGQIRTLADGTVAESYSWPAPAGTVDNNGKPLPDGSRLTLLPDTKTGFYSYGTQVVDPKGKLAPTVLRGRMGQAPIEGMSVDTSSMTPTQSKIYGLSGSYLNGAYPGMTEAELMNDANAAALDAANKARALFAAAAHWTTANDGLGPTAAHWTTANDGLGAQPILPRGTTAGAAPSQVPGAPGPAGSPWAPAPTTANDGLGDTRLPVVAKPTLKPTPSVGAGAGVTALGDTRLPVAANLPKSNTPHVEAVASLPALKPPTVGKAPVVAKPAPMPTPSVGAGAGVTAPAPIPRSNTSNVQATATLPPIAAPKPAPAPPPSRIAARPL